MAIAANAAYQSAPPSYHLYSMLGHFLGPALTDRKLFCTVRKIRDTRTFATRQVEVSQAQDDGSRRLALFVVADFQVREKASLLTYSAPPSKPYSNFENSPTMESRLQSMIQAKIIPQKVADVHNVVQSTRTIFRSETLSREHFHTKPQRHGQACQNGPGSSTFDIEDVCRLVQSQRYLGNRSATNFHARICNGCRNFFRASYTQPQIPR